MNKTILTSLFFILTVCACRQTNTNAVSDKTDFNFGFEKTKPGQKLPDKWFQWGSDYNLSIDTLIKHNGKNSILIQPSETRKPNPFGGVAYKIPAVYDGKNIEVRAFMKLEDVKEGFVTLMLLINGPSGNSQSEILYSENLNGTSDWKSYSVKLPLAKSAMMINIGAILTGTGKLWVDDFEVFIDGIAINKARQKEPNYEGLKNVMSHVSSNTYRIRTITPSDTDFKDLEPLKIAIRGARVVMLGEQDHGDAPSFLAKTRIIKYLHEQLDFDVLAFESDFYALNRTWEQAGRIKSSKIFENIYSVWTKCVQTEELFKYIDIQLNTSNPLILTGFDSRHASTYSKKHYNMDFDSIIKATHIAFNSTSNGRLNPILSDIIEKEYTSSIEPEQQQYFFKCLDTIQQQLEAKEFLNKVFWMQEIKNLKAHADNGWNRRPVSKGGQGPQDNDTKNIRDLQMGDNLLWLIKQKYPDKKIIVWGANSHVAKNINQTDNYSSAKTSKIQPGDEVFKVLGDSLYIIGFDSYTGTAGRISSSQVTVSEPQKEWFESWIKIKGYEYAFVNLKNYRNKEDSFIMKGFGHGPQKGNWTNVFDGVFYIENMYPCDTIMESQMPNK